MLHSTNNIGVIGYVSSRRPLDRALVGAVTDLDHDLTVNHTSNLAAVGLGSAKLDPAIRSRRVELAGGTDGWRCHNGSE